MPLDGAFRLRRPRIPFAGSRPRGPALRPILVGFSRRIPRQSRPSAIPDARSRCANQFSGRPIIALRASAGLRSPSQGEPERVCTALRCASHHSESALAGFSFSPGLQAREPPHRFSAFRTLNSPPSTLDPGFAGRRRSGGGCRGRHR